MPLYDYRCGGGHVQEAIRPMDVAEIHCACGRKAMRVGANRVAITAPSVDTRGLFRRFNEASQELDHRATAIESSTGSAVATPPYWKMAKQQARAMIAAGEAPAPRKDLS